MPQMSPMMWMILYMYFLLIYMFILVILYFMSMVEVKFNKFMNKINKNFFLFKW